jgi:hypothetical protein
MKPNNKYYKENVNKVGTTGIIGMFGEERTDGTLGRYFFIMRL